MKEFITKNFQFLIVIILFVVLMVQRCGTGKSPEIQVKRDTTVSVIYHYYKDSVKSIPQIINIIPPKQTDIPAIMIPDGTYTDLKKKYDSLLIAYYTKNIQQDSIKIDSFGYIKTLDTVNQNVISGRKWITNLKIPEKTTTITVTQTLPSKTQYLLGGSISGTQESLINGGGVGFLIVNKKQQAYGVDIKLMNKIGTVYEARTYWNLNKLFK
jgi:hypothetical protein